MPSNVPPIIQEHFNNITLELIEEGLERYSADAVLHQIRWRMQVGKGKTVKCLNAWTPTLAREFIKRHPQHSRFFVLRPLKENVAPGMCN